MSITFHPDAADELEQAVAYYEDCQPGLGAEFLAEVEAGLSRITALPLGWPVVADDIRRCLLRRFPFGLLYTVREGDATILAVMHLRREPGYWDERV